MKSLRYGRASVRKNSGKKAPSKPASLASLAQLKAEGFAPRFTPVTGAKAQTFTYISPAGEKTVDIPMMYRHAIDALVSDSPSLEAAYNAEIPGGKSFDATQVVTRKRIDQGLHIRRAKVDELRKELESANTAVDDKKFRPIETTVKGPHDIAYIGITVPQRLRIAQEYAGPSVCLGAYIGNNPNQPYVGMWFRKHCWAFCEGGRRVAYGITLPKLPGIELLDEVVSYDNGKPHASEQDFADAIALAKKWLPVSAENLGVDGRSRAEELSSEMQKNTFEIGALRDASAWLQIQREEASAKPSKLLPDAMVLFQKGSPRIPALKYAEVYNQFKALIDEKVKSYPPHQRAAKYKSLWKQALSALASDEWAERMALDYYTTELPPLEQLPSAYKIAATERFADRIDTYVEKLRDSFRELYTLFRRYDIVFDLSIEKMDSGLVSIYSELMLPKADAAEVIKLEAQIHQAQKILKPEIFEYFDQTATNAMSEWRAKRDKDADLELFGEEVEAKLSKRRRNNPDGIQAVTHVHLGYADAWSAPHAVFTTTYWTASASATSATLRSPGGIVVSDGYQQGVARWRQSYPAAHMVVARQRTNTGRGFTGKGFVIFVEHGGDAPEHITSFQNMPSERQLLAVFKLQKSPEDADMMLQSLGASRKYRLRPSAALLELGYSDWPR